MGQVGQVDQLEFKLARSFTADLLVRRILKKIVSFGAACFFLICAIELLSIMGQIGFVRMETALLLVSPLYIMALGRLMSAMGVEFQS